MYTRQFKISDTYTSSRLKRRRIRKVRIFSYIYRSRNVKTSARQRKPLKLQTRIIASIVAFDDGLVFNVDDDDDE